MTKKIDVEEDDLYAELKKTLESDESEEEETSGASAQEPTEEDTTSETQDVVDENEEMSEEEISKLSPRAQKRIRDLAEQVKTLAEKEETPKPQEEKKDVPHNFKDVQEFLSAVQDGPSRQLLEKFYGVIKAENSAILAPLEQKNNETKFETEFSQYEKIEGMKDYKESLKKTFLRNPKQSIKALVGETLADLYSSKVKPIEKKPSSPRRDGTVDTSKLSLEELYNTLDSMRD